MRAFISGAVLATAFILWLLWIDYAHGEPRTVFDYDRLYDKHCVCIRDGDKPDEKDDCDCIIDGEHEFDTGNRPDIRCEKRVHE